MQNVQTISYAPSGKVWRLTYDGNILGDSKGYDTREAARTAALAVVQNEHAAATTERRHAEKVFKPYF